MLLNEITVNGKGTQQEVARNYQAERKRILNVKDIALGQSDEHSLS